MREGISTGIRRTSSFLAIIGLMSSSIASAQSCGGRTDELVSLISKLKSRSQDESKGTEGDFGSATSSSYASNYFKKFESWNSGVTEASKLVTKGYNLANHVKPLAEGKQQTSLPPTVTNSMSNLVKLAEAAANEDNTKLDIAQIRCEQSTQDTALEAFLKQTGNDTVSQFKSAKYNICKVVSILADLQDKKQKLDQLRKDGYPLFFLHVKETKTFGGSYKRTIQFKLDLRLNPIYPDTAEINGGDQKFILGQLESIKLSYNSYFKFSDDNWTKLNLYQYFMSDIKSDGYCPMRLNLTSSVNVKLCINKPTIKEDSLQIRTYAKFHYKGDDRTAALPTITVPAPFGYLADVSDMKEKKMDDLKAKLVNRLVSVFKDFSGLDGKAEEWKKQCA